MNDDFVNEKLEEFDVEQWLWKRGLCGNEVCDFVEKSSEEGGCDDDCGELEKHGEVEDGSAGRVGFF